MAGLGLLATILIACIAWQIERRDLDAGAPPVRAAAGPAAAAVIPQDQGREAAAMVAAILARPLFAATRRPRAEGSTAAAQPASPPPRLSGVLVTPAGSSAIFVGQPRSIVVREGDRIGGFEVRSIEAGQVMLLGPDGPRLVRPSFDRTPPVLAEASRPLSFDPRPGAPPPAPPPPLGPGSAAPPLDQAFPVPGPSPPQANGPQDAMPPDQKSAPSGLDIIRNLPSAPR